MIKQLWGTFVHGASEQGLLSITKLAALIRVPPKKERVSREANAIVCLLVPLYARLSVCLSVHAVVALLRLQFPLLSLPFSLSRF